jgi:hypothetical protein
VYYVSDKKIGNGSAALSKEAVVRVERGIPATKENPTMWKPPSRIWGAGCDQQWDEMQHGAPVTILVSS